MEVIKIFTNKSTRQLLINFVKTDLIGEYKNSFFGTLWNFIFPLVTMLIYAFVFGGILKVNASRSGDIPFILFLFAGFLVWFTFNESINLGKNAIISNANFIKKTVFPLKILLIRIGLYAFVKQLILFLLFLLFYLIINGGIYIGVLWLPLIMVFLMVFCYSINLLTSSLTPYFRDLSQIIMLVLRALFYLTFIMYPITLIENIISPRLVLLLNPVASFIIIVRSAAFENYINYPLDYIPFVSIAGWILLFLVVGTLVFNHLRKDFADIL